MSSSQRSKSHQFKFERQHPHSTPTVTSCNLEKKNQKRSSSSSSFDCQISVAAAEEMEAARFHRARRSLSRSNDPSRFSRSLSPDFQKGIRASKMLTVASEEGNENEKPPEQVRKQPKNFMSTTISSASKKRVLTDKNDAAVDDAPGASFEKNPHAQKPCLAMDCNGSSQFSTPTSKVRGPVGRSQPEVYSVSASPGSQPYDPSTNYLSPRPKFLRYDPNRSREMLLRIERERRKAGDEGSDISTRHSSELEDFNRRDVDAPSDHASPASQEHKDVPGPPLDDVLELERTNDELNFEDGKEEEVDVAGPPMGLLELERSNCELYFEAGKAPSGLVSPSSQKRKDVPGSFVDDVLDLERSNDEHEFEEEEEEEEVEGEEFEEERSSKCSLVWKTLLLLGVLLFSSYGMLDMSCSVITPFSMKEFEESHLGFQYSIPQSGESLELCQVRNLKMFMESSDTCLDLKFNGSTTVDGNEEADELVKVVEPEAKESNTEINLVVENDGTAADVYDEHLNEGGEEFADSSELLENDQEDSSAEELNDGNEVATEMETKYAIVEDELSNLGETLNVEEDVEKSGEETGEQVLEHEENEINGFNPPEEDVSSADEIEDVHVHANGELNFRQEESSWLPLHIVMVVVFSLAAIVSGVWHFFHKKKEVPMKNFSSYPWAPAKLEFVEAGGFTSNGKKVVESKVGSHPSMLHDSVGYGETGTHSPVVRLLGDYSFAGIDATKKEEDYEVKLKNVEDRFSMSSSKSLCSSSQPSTAESTSYGSITTNEYFVAKKKGGVDGGKDTVMTPVRRSSRIRNHVTSP